MTPPPDDNNTPTRPIRVPIDLWDAFGEALEKMDIKNRSMYLREVMRWVIHDTECPKPKAPRRPVEPTPRKKSKADDE